MTFMDGTYDPDADMAYLRLIPRIDPGSSKRQVVARLEGIADDLVFDLDQDGRILGIEVFGASTVLRPETIEALPPPGAP
jgi:uncharacterized protein YuzE